MKKVPMAVIFGTNERIWWDYEWEAKLYRFLYNTIHGIFRTGKYISSIFYVPESDTNKGKRR